MREVVIIVVVLAAAAWLLYECLVGRMGRDD
jgi:hypothetical protein